MKKISSLLLSAPDRYIALPESHRRVYSTVITGDDTAGMYRTPANVYRSEISIKSPCQNWSVPGSQSLFRRVFSVPTCGEQNRGKPFKSVVLFSHLDFYDIGTAFADRSHESHISRAVIEFLGFTKKKSEGQESTFTILLLRCYYYVHPY